MKYCFGEINEEYGTNMKRIVKRLQSGGSFII
jgi:hypothetical protein